MTRKKISCDVCGERNGKILNRHHIIPQCDERCTNKDYNISILCPNCHTNVHEGEIIIIGLYQSTSGWKLIWYKKGEEPPIEKDFWLIKQNPLILRRKDNGSN